MNISDALEKAMAEKGCAILGELKLIPFRGRMGTSAGGGTYNDFNRIFKDEKCYMNIMSYDELISQDWIVCRLEKSQIQTTLGQSEYTNLWQ